jgi:hypothetical protein
LISRVLLLFTPRKRAASGQLDACQRAAEDALRCAGVESFVGNEKLFNSLQVAESVKVEVSRHWAAPSMRPATTRRRARS